MMAPLTLVVSASHLATVDLSPLIRLTECNHIAYPTPTVAQFFSVASTQNHAIQQFVDEKKIDALWVKPDRCFTDFGLIVCDMDATFIEVECIDEIAARFYLKPQIATITEQAMCGAINFAKALEQRVALLKGLPVAALEEVYQNAIRLTPGAQALVDMAHQYQLRFMLLSGGFTYFANRLKQDYHLDFALANELDIEQGILTGLIKTPIIDGSAKARLLTEVGQSLGLTPKQIIAIGDGANDIPMLEIAGASIAFRAKPKVAQVAHYRLQYSPLDTVRWLFK